MRPMSGGRTGMPAERQSKAQQMLNITEDYSCSTARRAEAPDLRVQGYTFEVIGKGQGKARRFVA